MFAFCQRNSLLLFVFAMVFVQSLWALSTIRIYQGPGASEPCVKGIISTLKLMVHPDHPIKTFDSFEALVDDLQKDREKSVLIMPGGSAAAYGAFYIHLSQEAREYLKSHLLGQNASVSILGICAGAYWLGEKYSVHCTNRWREKYEYQCPYPEQQIPLFKNMAGEYDTFRTHDELGAQYPEIAITQEVRGPIFWNGGPYIEQHFYAHPDIYFGVCYDVIATYQQSRRIAVAARDTSGHTIAIASGVHFEFYADPESSPLDQTQLAEGKEAAVFLAKTIFRRLRLTLDVDEN